jgi:hypothetical protein
MATAAPPAPDTKPALEKKPAPKTKPPQPPDDTSWRRYSPHSEAPLSAAGSAALHLLGIGFFILLGLLIFNKRKLPDLPVEMVRYDQGGRGQGRGNGSGNNVGDGRDIEDGKDKGDGSVEKGLPEDGKLILDPTKIAALKEQYKDDPDALRAIQRGNPNIVGFSQMHKEAQEKYRRGLNPGGNNGPGGDGGNKGGTSGDGDGNGPGRKLNAREKRMARWQIVFENSTATSYLNQIHAVGAIIGIPAPDGKSYRMIKDLSKRPAKILNEDPTELGLLGWFSSTTDKGRQLTDAVMFELGVKPAPDQYMVFFPRDLEEKFAAAERSYRGYREDQIDFTFFQFVPDGKGKLKPLVIRQTLK